VRLQYKCITTIHVKVGQGHCTSGHYRVMQSGYLPYYSPVIFPTIAWLSSVVDGIDYELDYDCYLWL
jgi:hypothetical protein